MSKLLQAFFSDTLRALVTLGVAVLVACPISILFILVPLWEDNRYRLGD